jgi:two-component system, NtrC family, sensor kinase
MKIGRVFPDLLTPLGSAQSIEQGLERTLRRLVALTGAAAGALVFRPPHAEPIVVTAGPRASARALRAIVRDGARPPAARQVLSVPLGVPGRPVGVLALLGRRRGLPRTALPPGFGREFGTAIEHVWRLHRRTQRITALNEITRLLVSGDSLDDVFRAFVEGLARLVTFDSVAVSLMDPERGEFEVIDVVARSVPRAAPRDVRLPVERTLLEQVIAGGAPLRVDDLEAPSVPSASRATLVARGWRSAVLAPLVTQGGVFGAVTLVSARLAAFDDADVESALELARPLASAIEQRRLLDESRRRAEELAALYGTSQLITARLDVASVLERISRSVTALIGSTGCGIGLLDTARGVLVHAAAHGYRSEEWRALAMPVGEGLMGRCAETGQAVLVDDVRRDPRSARRDVDERESIRSMLCVPLRIAGSLLGVISAFSTRPAAFSSHHQRVLEAFAEQAGIAIQNAQLFEESVRRARETRALFEAGRAVTASLDLGRTISVIMEQARAVLGVESCGIMTLDPDTRVLSSIASLDLPNDMVSQVQIREGEGVTGMAVAERRPVQSADLWNDPRVRYPQLPRAQGLRSLLAAPLRVGDTAIGAILVFRRDVHEFSAAEEELLLALADQAAIAMEHARLYERLEAMVAARTRELDQQKRFVEVVLQTLPLGVFVLDANLAVVSANREGGRALGEAPPGKPFPALVPAARAAEVEAFLRAAFTSRRVESVEHEVAVAGDVRIFRLTVAPLEGAGDGAHVVLLVADVTRAKHLERQMLLTERLTTAGRLAAGVAHELNNPLATIAGCAEALTARLREHALADRPELADFPGYLTLIEEEAFRCKEITGSLLQFVREPGDRRALADLNQVVQKTIELLSHQARFAESRFATELDPDLPPVVINEGQFRQVFLGIASNGLEAMEGRGRLTIRTRQLRGAVEVELEDEGPGIPDEQLGRIFDPFFTTKPPGQGTGLGLAIAQGIVADHGGRIEVQSRPGKGSVFRVIVPGRSDGGEA